MVLFLINFYLLVLNYPTTNADIYRGGALTRAKAPLDSYIDNMQSWLLIDFHSRKSVSEITQRHRHNPPHPLPNRQCRHSRHCSPC